MEQEERQFTGREMTVLRSLARDMELLAEEDLKGSGHPEVMFAPFRLMLRQMLEAGVAYAKTHPEAVEVSALAELQGYLDSGWLDPEGVAVVPDPVALLAQLRGMHVDDLKQVLTEEPGNVWAQESQNREHELVSMLADALDTAYKAGAGAPPSYGSRFGGQPVPE